MINSSEWKEFRIGDIFEVFTGSLLDVKTLKNGKIPRISVTNENNGILDYFDSENSNNARHFENFISVNFFGQCFYHPYKASLEMKVHVLKLKNREFNKNLGLFFSSILNKTLENKFTYSKQLSSSKLKNDDIKIILPTKNDKIDFDFMENFIDKIEQKQRGILEFYKHKKQNGGGYELNSKTWKKFRIGDLFDKLSAKFLGKGDKFKAVSKIKTTEFFVPVVYCKFGNNGIMYWAKKDDFETYKNVISIVYNGAIATGKVYAQQHETGILAESYFIKFKNREIDFKVNLFFQCVLEKVLYPKYSRDCLATWNDKVENDVISLPITANGEIDFDFMESFIKAIQKECIKGVDSYLAIATTKELIK